MYSPTPHEARGASQTCRHGRFLQHPPSSAEQQAAGGGRKRLILKRTACTKLESEAGVPSVSTRLLCVQVAEEARPAHL